VHEAGELAEARALRGFDAVHLASALQNGPDTVVVTGDKRLAAAARAEGLVVLLAA
jgi:predicted nucleic acid-binding protein